MSLFIESTSPEPLPSIFKLGLSLVYGEKELRIYFQQKCVILTAYLTWVMLLC